MEDAKKFSLNVNGIEYNENDTVIVVAHKKGTKKNIDDKNTQIILSGNEIKLMSFFTLIANELSSHVNDADLQLAFDLRKIYKRIDELMEKEKKLENEIMNGAEEDEDKQ